MLILATWLGVGLFNEAFYLRTNPDVAAAVAQGLLTAREHFDLYGKYESRSPSPFFDQILYLRANPDVADAVSSGLINAVEHFMSFGQYEGRSASFFFDPAVYTAVNSDVSEALKSGAFKSAFEHFVLHGQFEVRKTAPFFDLKGYLDANPDVADAVRSGHTTAFDHFINYGHAEGRNLGNGISLAQFASDLKAQAAIRSGDFNDLMGRVAEVAPFLATFVGPQGYSTPRDMPLPADFIPVGDEKLVVPPGVDAPAVLPPNFEQPAPEPQPEPNPGGGGGGGTPPPPVDKASFSFGPVAAIAQNGANQLWVGSGNGADNFAIMTTSESRIELGLKGWVRHEGDVEEHNVANNSGSHSVYTFGVYDKAGFAFSVASLGGKSIDQLVAEGYSFALTIDVDPGAGVRGPKLDYKNGHWVGEGFDIADSKGDSLGAVSQNIQTILWYDGDLANDTRGTLDAGTYTITLGMAKGDTVFEHSINLDVPYSVVLERDAKLSTIARIDGSNMMLKGNGNLATNFSVVTISNAEGALFELGLGAQQRGQNPYSDSNKDGVYNAANEAQFRFSVTDLVNDRSLIDLVGKYEFRLNVDRDPSVGVDCVQLRLKNDNGKLVWEVQNYKNGEGGVYTLTDGPDSADVTQNIQSLSWYQGDDGHLFAGNNTVANGTYDVSLQVLEGTTLIGQNTIQIEVGQG